MSAGRLAWGEQTHFSALASPAEKIATLFSRRVKQEPKNASALRRLLEDRQRGVLFALLPYLDPLSLAFDSNTANGKINYYSTEKVRVDNLVKDIFYA